LTSNGLQGVISQEIVLFMITAVRTSNHINFIFLPNENVNSQICKIVRNLFWGASKVEGRRPEGIMFWIGTSAGLL
jgi:hypothetical protein